MSQIKTINYPVGSLQRILMMFFLISLIVFMTLKGGTSGACAACKYQRRRCTTDCPLAPYFPAEQSKIFQNVHRLFGVRSIVKILENLDETQKPEAMKSIIFQSYVRDRNPVHGCLGITQQLQYMIWLTQQELKAVNSQLQLYRNQQNNNNNGKNHYNPHNQMIHEISEKQDVTSQLDLGMRLTVNNNQSNDTPFFSPLTVSETQQKQPQMCYSTHPYIDSCEEILTNNSINASLAWGQNQFPYHHNSGVSNQNEHCNEMKSNNGVMAIQSQLVNLHMVSNQQEEEDDVNDDYDEIHQFLEIIDGTQSFADTKEAFASSSGESLKERIDEIGERELTCFSLTSMI